MESDVERMHEAVKKSDVSKVKELLNDGISANIRNENGTSPMELAVVFGCIECLKELIENGGDVNEKDNSRNETLIFKALSQGRFPYLKLLLENGAKVNTLNSRGNSPLITSIILSQYEMANELLLAGADPSVKNGAGKTAFTYLEEDNLAKDSKKYPLKELVKNKIIKYNLK